MNRSHRDARLISGLIASLDDSCDRRADEAARLAWAEDEDGLFAAAEAHGIGPAMARFARRHDLAPAKGLRSLEASRMQQLIRQLSIVSEIEPAGRVLDAAGVDWVVMKGPAVSATIWPSEDMREYHDLDLLIRPEHYPHGLDALQEAGFQLLDQNWPLIQRQFRGELTLLSPRGVPLDVHWHAVNLAPLRATLQWSMNDLIARRRIVAMGSATAPTLDEVDTLLHLAYHAAHSGAHRLLWLKDVQLATHAAKDDVAEIRTRARAARLELIVSVVLDKVATVFADATVSSVAEGFPSSPWRDFVRRRDQAGGGLRPLAVGGTRRGLYTSTRTTTAGSATALLEESLGRMRSLRHVDSSSRHHNPLDDVVPDGAARRDFMERVRRSDGVARA